MRSTARVSIMARMDEPAWRKLVPPAERPLQFGIRDLLIAQAVVAACLGLFAVAGIFALLAIFVATVVFCAVQVELVETRLKRCIVDLTGGIALPALCIGCCFSPPSDDVSSFCVIMIVVQMLTLLVWMIVGSRLGAWKAVCAGMLFVGVLVLGAAAAPLLCLGLICFTVYGLGLLCFVPILTCCVLAHNVGDAMRQAWAEQGKWTTRMLFLFGVVLGAAIPATMYAVAGQWIAIAVRSAWPSKVLMENVFH